MKTIKLFSILAIAIAFSGCDALQQVTNTTGSFFSLNGKWQLGSNTPENTLLNTVVTVSAVNAGAITYLSNNSQCYRVNDTKWKNIKADKAGGFTIDNLLSNCSSGELNYQPATISVVNNNEIRVSGKNVAGQDNVQTWTRMQ